MLNITRISGEQLFALIVDAANNCPEKKDDANHLAFLIDKAFDGLDPVATAIAAPRIAELFNGFHHLILPEKTHLVIIVHKGLQMVFCPRLFDPDIQQLITT